ncbi:MAG: RNA polymerase subunit sigma [Gammaproteobacteria bacterium RIFOXYA12_FULL_61_12]|nr:MAG: RNA polymerase subunit sigma [Gammaproteobacteria bacterium RIFOXYD12_FULL_61_37]OGT92739.1 MAG: RNA polymerase subunit sigma [Gammaproteobacteria bacterium RIFOXYA12_FULL_61_12]
MAATAPLEQPVDDRALLRRIAAGDRSAMPVLFRHHYPRILRFILRMTGDRVTAEDLANEVFLEIWRGAGRFEGRSAVSTWMLSIAHNRTVSFLRKRSESPLDEDQAATIADRADTPDIAAAKLDKGSQIRACMERLSPDHREIIDLVYYHERSIPEITAILDIPEGTVKTRMFHARKNLGALLRNAGIDRGWP